MLEAFLRDKTGTLQVTSALATKRFLLGSSQMMTEETGHLRPTLFEEYHIWDVQ